NIRDRTYRNVIADPTNGGSLNESMSWVNNYSINPTLNFQHTFGDVHNFSGLVGFEYRRNFVREIETEGHQFPGLLFNVLNGSAKPVTAAGFTREFRKAGYFARLKY